VTTMTYTGKLQVVDCGVCHIPFAMPAELYRQLQDADDDGTFWCPAGCHLTFTSLAEHMAAEHPGFESEEPADA
jgi:hypothetical protein